MTVAISSFAKSRMRLLSTSDAHAVESIVLALEQGMSVDFISKSSAKKGTVLEQQEKIIH